MFKKLNGVVFGKLHQFSSMTFRRFGFDNYSWAAVLLFGAAAASLYLYRLANNLASSESNPKIAGMRERAAVGGVAVFVVLAVLVLCGRKHIRKYATRHYDLGQQVDPLLSFFGWFPVVAYFLSLPFMFWPGVLDMLLAGVGFMFLLSEPPPMEERMNRAFGE